MRTSCVTRASRTRSQRVEPLGDRLARRRQGLARAAACLLLSAPPVVLAHGEGGDVLPAEPGLTMSAAAALRVLDERRPLPSTRLDGVLLKGDAGMDPGGGQVEQATVAAAWRWHPAWGAYAAAGTHGDEPLRLEALWLQWRHDGDDHDALLTAGRQGLAAGPVLLATGPAEAFVLQPLAQRAALDHPDGDDGVQLGWRGSALGADLSVDGGLWRGSAFPGAPQGGRGGPGTSLHVGLAAPAWNADAVWLRLRPEARGTSTSPALGHSHGVPACDPTFTEVICFGGQVDLLGASARWRGAYTSLQWPLKLTGAGWWRTDDGRLESVNGLADYRGRTAGGWVDAEWAWHPAWSLGWRHERLRARHHLDGPGAALLALEARLQHAGSARRDTVQLAWQAAPWAWIGLAAGEETMAGSTGRFVALRLVVTTTWATLTTP
jgi:hypothetical protein